MTDAKLEIKVGAVTFTGEGSEKWLAEQLKSVLDKLQELTQISAESATPQSGRTGGELPHKSGGKEGRPKTTLAAFIKECKATTNQSRKFLATAAWLHDSEGKNRIATKDVTEALSKHNQGKLTNAGQCLVNNAKPGYIVKEGKQFYVSDQGREELAK